MFETFIGALSKNELCNMKVAILVGKSILTHAGLTKENLACYNNSASNMNDDSTQWIKRLHQNETNRCNNGN